jgi:hypothetical protein
MIRDLIAVEKLPDASESPASPCARVPTLPYLFGFDHGLGAQGLFDPIEMPADDAPHVSEGV